MHLPSVDGALLTPCTMCGTGLPDAAPDGTWLVVVYEWSERVQSGRVPMENIVRLSIYLAIATCIYLSMNLPAFYLLRTYAVHLYLLSPAYLADLDLRAARCGGRVRL